MRRREAVLDAILDVQLAAALEPVTDGGWPLVRDDPVAAWRGTAARTSTATKAVSPGPFTSGVALGGSVEPWRRWIADLAAAGCLLVEVHEPGAVGIGDDPAERARFRDLNERLARRLVGRPPLAGDHRRRGRRGRRRDDPGRPVFEPRGRPHRRPRQLATRPRRPARARDRLRGPRHDRGERRHEGAAGLGGELRGERRSRHRARGLATAGSLAALPWASVVTQAGRASRRRSASRTCRRRSGSRALDPRAVDIRTAALGRYDPAAKRPPPTLIRDRLIPCRHGATIAALVDLVPDVGAGPGWAPGGARALSTPRDT